MRVKILYNKRDSALIQFKEPQHAQTGKYVCAKLCHCIDHNRAKAISTSVGREGIHCMGVGSLRCLGNSTTKITKIVTHEIIPMVTGQLTSTVNLRVCIISTHQITQIKMLHFHPDCVSAYNYPTDHKYPLWRNEIVAIC